MKKKIIITILAVGLLTGCGKSIPKLANGEEALVEFSDGTKYSINEVWNEMKNTYALDIALAKIDSKILEEELKDQKKEIDEFMKTTELSIKSSFVDEDGNFDENLMLNNLKQYGFNSLEEFLNRRRISHMQELVTKDFALTKITDKQIKTYYKNESVGDIHCVHVLVKPDGSSDQALNEAKVKAEGIIKDIKSDIKSGTKSLDAFKKYEKDSSVTYQDLDYFNKGEMVKEFEDVAFALKKGAYTKTPVKTSFGYHVILKLDEKKKAELKDLKEDIKDTLADRLIEDDKNTSVNAMIELRKKYGVKWYDSELEDAYNKYMNYLINQNKNKDKE